MGIFDDILHPAANPVTERKFAILGRMTMPQLVQIYDKEVKTPESTDKMKSRSQLVMAIATNLMLERIETMAKDMKVDLKGIK